MRFKAFLVPLVCLGLFFALFSGGCKKQSLLTAGGVLAFSTDTLAFDTVFTAAGSYTNYFVIYNPQSQDVVLSSVRLEGGASSYFHLVVNGYSGNNIPNLKIAAHDSIYVMATVNINPSDTLTPFLIVDHMIATLNGKDFSVPFTAYGQNAHYIVSDSITTNTTWQTDKPYVVIHSCVVGQNVTLNIPPKCRVYMHQDARFFVFGKLNVGTIGAPAGGDSVVFQGDRLDRAYFGYKGYPGEWGGFLFISGGNGGSFNNAIIKNCGSSTPYWHYGIQSAAIEADSGASVAITNSKIENCIGYGIYCFEGNLTISNSLFQSTGAQALAMLKGGNATVNNCTFANYGSSVLSHSNNGTLALLNYFIAGVGIPPFMGDLNATFNNCIVYGSLDSEVVCDSISGAAANINFNHCLLKMGNTLGTYIHNNRSLYSQSPLFNQDPKFKSTSTQDFHLSEGSPAIGSADPAVFYGLDLDGKARTTNDMGCYKY